MFIVLVLGRWLMPKGDMSRDQLAHLLMVYISMGTDLLDISDTFKKSEIKTNHSLITVGLILFSLALMKFPFPVRKTHLKSTSSNTSCCSEIWSLLLTDGFQDGSFLVYRLYLLNGNIQKLESILFICKNILTVMLVLYRIGVIWFTSRRGGGER